MNSREEGAVQISGQAKGSYLSKIIKKEIQFLKNAPSSPTKKMIFIKNAAVDNFDRGNYKFCKVSEEKTQDKYIRTVLDIIKES